MMLTPPLHTQFVCVCVCADVSLALLVFLCARFNHSQASLSSFGCIFNRPGLSPSFLLQTQADL